MGGSVASNMASAMADNMEKSMQKNADTMINNQKKMAMQRREMMMATNFAFARDTFMWYSAFVGMIRVC